MKPILFNTEMVRAILEGRKIVTRRVVKPQPDVEHKHKLGYVVAGDKKDVGCFGFGTNECGGNIQYAKPPFTVNDVLYVRETWISKGNILGGYGYRADFEGWESAFIWRPSIHMPKEAARLFLRVTDVRVERLCDMKLADFLAEGIALSIDELRHPDTALYKAREKFRDLWNSTCGKPYTPKRYANNFYANPYVWVIEFTVISKEEALESV